MDQATADHNEKAKFHEEGSSPPTLYPKLDPQDLEVPPISKPPDSSPVPASSGVVESQSLRDTSNAYVIASPVAASSSKRTIDSVREALGSFGKKVVEATKQAEDLAGNVWQHLKTGPSIADAAMGRIAQGTKVLAEGGYEKIFSQTFETLPEEKLKNSFACYLSTSAGPVMGVLYLSSAKLAFCSDIPLSYKVEDKTEWSYYKVVIPLHQLRQINPSTSKVNPAEKYIQVISVDNHEFWFMGFVSYDGAIKNLQEALRAFQAP